MGINVKRAKDPVVVPAWIRAVAVAAGCFAFGCVFVLAWGSFLESTSLVLGAVVQPRSPRIGRWLMWVSALLLSAILLPTGSRVAYDFILYHHRAILWTESLIVLVAGLIVWCDVALVIDAMSQKRGHAILLQRSKRNLDWLVWVAALALTLYWVWGIVQGVRAYQLYGRLDPLVMSAAFTLVVLLFDVALIGHATRQGERVSDQ